MKTNKSGLDLIKSFEGCALKAYRCPAGVITIGYGETGTFTLTGQKIVIGMTITKEQAEKSFAMVLEKKGYENAVNKLGVELNENQFSALVSFCYNLGTGIFKGSLLKAIKKNDWVSVTSQMLLYNKARVNGKLTELKGLTRRRKAEVELFNTPINTTQTQVDDQLFNAVSKIIKQGKINIDFNSWKNVSQINKFIKYFPECILKITGEKTYDLAIDSLVSKGIISNVSLWKNKKYNANHVASLLIKYAESLK